MGVRAGRRLRWGLRSRSHSRWRFRGHRRIEACAVAVVAVGWRRR